jgi:hypothetical protein
MFANDNVVWASWRYTEEENIPNLRHTNEGIGAYVTAGARLHLYSYLDTDSVLFVQPSDEAPLVGTGGCLGAMTSELKPSEYIEEFVNGGPKNYAYRIVDSVTNKRKTICKVRDIKL